MSHADAYRRDDPDRRFLQSRIWREKIRPRQLARQPLCEHCAVLGIVRQADHVDHIKRPFGERKLQTDPDNFQSLCRPCHGRKSAWERSGSTKPLVLGRTADGWDTITAPGGEGQNPGRRG